MVLVPLLAWRPKMGFQSPHGVGAHQLNEHPRVWIAKQSFAEFGLKASLACSSLVLPSSCATGDSAHFEAKPKVEAGYQVILVER